MRSFAIVIVCTWCMFICLPAHAGPATRPSATGYTPPVSKYPLHYPVSDQTRSVMRTAREQIGLTTQDMQALGLSYEEAGAALEAIRDWVEPRRFELERARDEYLAARASFMSTQGKIYSLEQRLEHLRVPADADAGLKERLEAQLDRHRKDLPSLQARFEKIDRAYTTPFESVIEKVHHVLSLPQRRQWAASRQNKRFGLPVTLQFLPDVTEPQVRQLQQGEDVEAVFTSEQRRVNAAAMAKYVTHKPVIYRAELKFFFGRDLASDDPPEVRPVSHQETGSRPSSHGASSGTADASKCPLHALFGKKPSLAESQPKD